MKTQSNLCKFEILKRIEVRDIINLIVFITGIVISNVELLQLRKFLVNGSQRFIIYNIILSVIMILMFIYGVRNRIENIINIMNVKNLEEKNKNLSELNDHIRCFKHDFNNILQAIDGYIILDDMSSLQKYFNSLIKECDHVNCMEVLNYKLIDNPALYGVILNKYKIAEKNNIKMNIDILANIEKFNDKSYILSRMLGILLDNALEATSECKEKVINVQFLKEENKNRDVIIIENTYTNTDVDTNKIFEKNYTTKKDKGNSGLGLWKIRDILRKNNNLDLFTTKDEVMFRQQIEIYH